MSSTMPKAKFVDVDKSILRPFPLTLDITCEQIANLMTSAIESGGITYWCPRIILINPQPRSLPTTWPWYAEPTLYAHPALSIMVSEQGDAGRVLKRHPINARRIIAGLRLLATKYPHHFTAIITDNADMHTADAFVQCAALNELRYG